MCQQQQQRQPATLSTLCGVSELMGIIAMRAYAQTYTHPSHIGERLAGHSVFFVCMCIVRCSADWSSGADWRKSEMSVSEFKHLSKASEHAHACANDDLVALKALRTQASPSNNSTRDTFESRMCVQIKWICEIYESASNVKRITAPGTNNLMFHFFASATRQPDS